MTEDGKFKRLCQPGVNPVPGTGLTLQNLLSGFV